MVKIEDECVGCTDVGLPCMGTGCPNRNFKQFYCDECGERRTLYRFFGKELCVHDGAFGLAWLRCGVEMFYAFTSICNVEYEVLGNIHSNLELLEVKE